jgi:hypothetical protein
MLDKFDIDVVVHQAINNGYRLKVNFPEFGMFSPGWTIRHSDINDSGWWVQPPSYKDGTGKWHQSLEFNKREKLWCAIEEKCIEMANFEDGSSRSALPSPGERDVVVEEVLSDSDFNTMLDEAYAKPNAKSGGDSHVKS